MEIRETNRNTTTTRTATLTDGAVITATLKYSQGIGQIDGTVANADGVVLLSFGRYNSASQPNITGEFADIKTYATDIEQFVELCVVAITQEQEQEQEQDETETI